jgi:protein gp37
VSDKSAIEWTDATWNPVRGCTKVSAGCKNCYAERFAERFRGVPGHAFEQGFDVRLVPDALDLPLRWKKPRRVFVNSMSDLFHEDVPFHYVDQVFGVMAACRYGRDGGPGHTFQILTKRAERMKTYLSTDRRRAWAFAGARIGGGEDPDPMFDQIDLGPQALPNVWLGVSVEDQAAADERIPELLATKAAVRFLSCEPLLGPVDLRRVGGDTDSLDPDDTGHESGGPAGWISGPAIDWVIVGGESGSRARAMEEAWARSIVEQCRAASVPVFVKQMGSAWANGGKGSDPQHWPADLRVRELPEVR